MNFKPSLELTKVRLEASRKVEEVSRSKYSGHYTALARTRRRLFATATLLAFVFLTNAVPAILQGVGAPTDGLTGFQFRRLLALVVVYFTFDLVLRTLRVKRSREAHGKDVEQVQEILSEIGIKGSEAHSSTRQTDKTDLFSDIMLLYIPIIVGVGSAVIGLLPSQG